MTALTTNERPTNPLLFALRRNPLAVTAGEAIASVPLRWRQRATCRQMVSTEIGVCANGIALTLNLSDLSDFRFFEKITGDGYEDETVSLLFRLIRPGDTCLDVGANRGYLTLVMARLAGESGTVHSIEPSGRSLEELRRNVELNTMLHHNIARVVIHPILASDSEGFAQLYSSSVDNSEDSVIPFHNSAGSIIKSRSLDDELPPPLPLRLVKIDVEGSELHVLKGMRTIVEQNPDLYVVIEWNRGYTTKELWEELYSSFNVFRILEGTNQLGLVQVTNPDQLGGANLLCINRSASPGTVAELQPLIAPPRSRMRHGSLATLFELLRRMVWWLLGPASSRRTP